MSSMTRKTKRSAALAAAVALTATLGLTACGSSDSKAGSDDALLAQAPVADARAIPAGSTMAKIKAKGQLFVATALDAPLISQQSIDDPTKVSGFDAELAKMLAKYIIGSAKVKWTPSASETREALLGNGTVDTVFSTYTITTDRAKVVDFAGPYFMSGLAVAVKADNNSIHSVSDLAGKKVIVQTGTPSTVEVPKRAQGASLIPFATTPEGVKALEQGRGDAYIQDVDLLASMSSVDHNFKVVGAPFTQEPYGIGLKHGDDAMKKFVNDWLTQIYKSGLWAKVYKSTIGSVGETPVPPTPVIGSVPGS